MNTTYVLFLLLLICCIYTVISRHSIEEFYPVLRNRVYYNVEDTINGSLQYIGCGNLTLSAPKNTALFLEGKGDDPTLLTSVSFYHVKKKLGSFQEISSAILPTLQAIQLKYPDHNIGPVAALVSKLSNTQIEVIYYLPNFDTKGVPIVGMNALAKAHRSYYRIVYSTLYTNPSKLCIHQTTTQCPGVHVRTVMQRPSLYGQTRTFASIPSASSSSSYGRYGGLGGYYYDPYNYWIIHNYYTPCGTPKDRHFKYYAIYLLNPTDPLYNGFSIDQNPNLSFISEYSGIRYGCDFQVVSPNKKYMLRLDEFTNRSEPPGLVLYKILEGDPFLECRNKESFEKETVWKIPLSYGNYVAPPDEERNKPLRTDYNYAHFKIENDTLYLVDKDITVWSYKIDVSRSPAIMQLNDQGSLVVYDAKNEVVDNTLTSGFMKRVANREKSSRYFIDDEYIAENERKFQEYTKREAQYAQALSEKEKREQQTYYNKEICPIGFVEGEI